MTLTSGLGLVLEVTSCLVMTSSFTSHGGVNRGSLLLMKREMDQMEVFTVNFFINGYVIRPVLQVNPIDTTLNKGARSSANLYHRTKNV